MSDNIADTFKKIHQEHSDGIFRFCLVRVSSREDALDITQETFLRLWNTFLENKVVENNRAFLFTIARHLVIDWYRKKKAVTLDKMLSDENFSFDIPDEKELNNTTLGVEGRYLLSKINEISETNREPLYLRFVENLSPIEISKILEVSANVISVRINRGLEELRQMTGYNN